MSRLVTVKYKKAPDWKMVVAVAVAEHPKANAVAKTTARKVAAQAKRNLMAGAVGSGKSKGKLHPSKKVGAERNIDPNASLEIYRKAVAKETFYKDTEVRRRRKVVPGSPVPVSIVVSDHWAAQAFEYGRGSATAMSRFFKAAVNSAAGGNITKRGGK